MEALWFAIISGMLTVFVVTDGFDFGAGILHLFVAKTDRERQVVYSAIGPVWNGNEVWLVASGGVLFFAFPRAYAGGFSGFYLPLMITLWLLLLRGISIEFRAKSPNPLWRSLWDGGFAVASMLLPVILGAALGNILRGVPLEADGFFAGSLFTNFQPGPRPGALDWYTVLVAFFALAALAGHGALFLIWKTTGPVQERSRRLAAPLWIAAAVLGLAATAATEAVQPALYRSLLSRPWSWCFALAMGVSLGLIVRSLLERRELAGFLASCGFIAAMLGATAAGLFPNLLISTLNRGFTLDAYNASAGTETLRLGLPGWLTAMGLATAYFALLFRSFRAKVGVDQLDEYGGVDETPSSAEPEPPEGGGLFQPAALPEPLRPS